MSLPEELRSIAAAVSCSAICDAMMRRHAHRAHVSDLVGPAPERWLLGPAVTMQFVPLRADLMARMEHHRDRYERYERILKKRFPQNTASPADLGKLLTLRLGLRHERMVAEWCEEAIEALSAMAGRTGVVSLGNDRPREDQG